MKMPGRSEGEVGNYIWASHHGSEVIQGSSHNRKTSAPMRKSRGSETKGKVGMQMGGDRGNHSLWLLKGKMKGGRVRGIKSQSGIVMGPRTASKKNGKPFKLMGHDEERKKSRGGVFPSTIGRQTGRKKHSLLEVSISREKEERSGRQILGKGDYWDDACEKNLSEIRTIKEQAPGRKKGLGKVNKKKKDETWWGSVGKTRCLTGVA